MANSNNATGRQPARYQIKIKGKIRENWSDWLNGMEISTSDEDQAARVTTLVGMVPDQAALRGILCKNVGSQPDHPLRRLRIDRC